MPIPLQITQGDTVAWKDTAFVHSNGEKISPTVYDLHHLIRGPSNRTLDIVQADKSDSTWSSLINHEESNLFVPGQYWVAVVAVSDTARLTVFHKSLTVLPSAVGFTGDAVNPDMSFEERQLVAVERAIADILTKGVSSYEIKGRQATYLDLEALEAMRKSFRLRIAKQKGQSKDIRIRFN